MFLQPRFLASLALIPALGLAVSCAGGGNNPTGRAVAPAGDAKGTSLRQEPQGPPAKVKFSVANDGPALGFEAVTVGLEGVAIRQGDHAWVDLPLAAGVHRVELLTPGGAAQATLAKAPAVPPGVYDQLRLTLAQGQVHSVQLTNGHHVRDLAVPKTLTASGLNLPVVPGGALEAVFAFPVAHAIRETAPGSGSYVLRAAISGALLDRGAVSGSISGKVTWASGGAPVSGVTVTAQAAADGATHLLRTVTTGADGSYHLDLLPPGTHHVVVLPSLGVCAHDLALGTPALHEGKGQCDLTLQPLRARPASIQAPALPASAGHGAILLLRKVDQPGSKSSLWVIVGSSPAQERGPVVFEALGPGRYRIAKPSGGAASGSQRDLFEKGLTVVAGDQVAVPAWPSQWSDKPAPESPKPSSARLSQK
jgi:hypothetical protein